MWKWKFNLLFSRRPGLGREWLKFNSSIWELLDFAVTVMNFVFTFKFVESSKDFSTTQRTAEAATKEIL